MPTSQATTGGNGGASDGHADLSAGHPVADVPGGAGGGAGTQGGNGTGQTSGYYDGAGGGGGGVGAAGGQGGAGGDDGSYAAANGGSNSYPTGHGSGGVGGPAGAVGMSGGPGGDDTEQFGQSFGPGGGGGGGGGAGALVTSSTTISSNLTGGAGGKGGASQDGGGGGGGAGGYGVQDAGVTVTVASGVTVQGGQGGDGGSTGSSYSLGGQGGGGGGGFYGSGVLINQGVILAGAGGASGTGNGAQAAAPNAAASVIGTGLEVVNTGTIGQSGQSADAIAFISGTNSLTLSSGGVQGVLNGAIGVTGSLSIDPGSAAGASVTLANLIQDDSTAGHVNKAGAGTLLLTAVNTYTGGTTINAGTLELGTGGKAGSGAISFGGTAAETLQIDSSQANNSTYANTLDSLHAGDVLDLRGLAYATGASATVSGSTLTVTSNGVSNKFTVSNYGTLSLSATNDGSNGTLVTFSAPSAPPTVVAETATVLAGGTVTGTGGTGGTGALAGDSDPNGGSLSITSVSGNPVAANSASASNPTTVNGSYGALTIGADGSYSYVANNGLAIVTHADSTITDTFTDVVTASEGPTANSSLAVTVTLGAGGAETVTNPTGSATYTIGATTLTLNETSNTTFSGAIQDGSSGNTGGKVVKTGSGTLTLSGASTYTGGTTISAGGITATQTSSLGTGAVTDNGALAFSGASGTFANNVAGSGSLSVSGVAMGSMLTFSGALTQAGGFNVTDVSNVTLTASSLYSAGNSILTHGGVFTLLGTANVSGAEGLQPLSGGTVNVGSSSDGAAQLIGGNSGINSSASAALTVNNYGLIEGQSYEGVTYRGAGTLTLTNSGAGVIYAQGSNESTAWGVGSNGGADTVLNVTNQSGGKIVGVGYGVYGINAGDTIVNAGTIAAGGYNTGTGAVTVGGTAGVYLSAGGAVTNQAGGQLQGGSDGLSSAGLLKLSNAGQVSSGGDAVLASAANASILNTGSITSSNYSGVTGAAGSAVVNAAGATLAGGTNGTYGYAVQFAAGTGAFDNFGTAAANGRGVFVNNNLGGATTGTGVTLSLEAGSTTGALTLGAQNDAVNLYTGAVTTVADTRTDPVSGAAVTVRAAGTYAAASFTTLNLGGGANIINLLGSGDGAANGAAGTLALGNVVTTGGTNDALNKSGAGLWTLTGAGTFTGATAVSAGTLAVDATAYASAITVSGGLLRGTGTSAAGVTVQSGGAFTPGEGGTGAFTTTAAFALNAGSTLGISAAGGATTSVNAGSATLGGALNFAYSGGAEAYGTTYDIVHVTGASSGTFSNYAAGATFVSGGQTFQVSYTGGVGGHDVVLTDVTNTVPTITGANGSQATNDKTPDQPFSTVVVTDPDAGQTQTATVSFTAANGTLSGLGTPTVSGGVATYTVTGSATAVTNALEAASFTPTPNQAAPGQTVSTTFTIADSDGHGGSASDSTTKVVVTSVNDPPTTANGSAGQAITDKATATAFAQVTVGDPDVGQTETATITYTAANGTLSGTGLSGSAGNYTLSATTPAALQGALQALVFTPTANQVAPGATVQTTFSVSVSDGTAAASTSDTVTTTSVNDAPVVGNSLGGQTVGDRSTINPFTTVTVTDPDTGQGETVTVTLSNPANGTLSGGGFVMTAPGVYTATEAAGFAGASAAAAQAALRAAVFTPTATAIPNAPTQTTFTIAVTDGSGATSTDSGTQVTTTHTTNTAPTLGGFAAGQATNDKTAVNPFANATVSDPDSQTETVTVTLSASANGVLSGGGFASIGGGSYQVTAVNAAAAQADLRALVFTPTANQVAPGQTVTTGFTVQVNDTQTTASNSQTTEVVTSVNDAPAIAGAHGSATSDRVTVNPFSGVTVTDPDTGQGETVTVTLSNPANGTLSGGGFVQTSTPGVYTATEAAGSAGGSAAAAAQAALQAAVFTPTAQPAGAAATTTSFAVQVSDGTAAATDGATSVTATHTTNTPVQVANASPTQATNDKATAQPFAGVTVTDPDTGQTETATITYAAANGTLTGAGLAGSAGSYTLSAGSAAALQSALQALVFTPTANQVAPGATVQTTFALSVGDGASTAQTGDAVTATSVNDPPAIGAFQNTATAPSSQTAVLEPNLTLSDPDVGAKVSSAQVSLGGFVPGDTLTVTPSAGIAAAYNTATGVLTLTGTASDAAYQATLETVTFGHNGSVNPGQRTATFTVTDDQGASTSASETVNVGGFTQPSTGGGTSTVPTNLDAQQQFPTQTSNLLRITPTDPALSNPASPIYQQAQAEKAIAARLDNGQMSLADAQNALYHLVDGTTSVAEITYSFFTGKTPTQVGLNYLVHSDSNATDLNDPYYAQFTTENRYINFSANLGRFGDSSTSAFHQAYDSLSLRDATAKAYTAIFGVAATADKVSAILDSLVPDGLGGTETRAQYFAYYGTDGLNGIGTKSAMIGWLLADSVKEGFGTYQQADLHFLADLAHGTAVFNVDLLAAYGTVPTLVGQPTTDTSLHG